MYTNTPRLQRGLSLVEVFVALLVLSVGLIALAKLQVDLVRGSGDARARTIALSLAEEKIEDLRTFAETGDGTGTWSVTANPMKWTYISGPAITTPADTSCSPPRCLTLPHLGHCDAGADLARIWLFLWKYGDYVLGRLS